MKLKKFTIIILIILQLFILSGCAENNGDIDIQNKNKQQLDYIDSRIVSMINSLNNISIQNYKVITKDVKLQSQEELGSATSDSQSSSGSSSSSQGQSQGGESQESGSQGENSQDTPKVKVSEMTAQNILSSDKKTDWNNMKQEIESMYETWNSIVLDLYKLNIKNEDILSFSTNLDSAALAIKNEDKTKALEELSDLYSHIPKYLEYYSNDTAENNIKRTKLHIIYAYTALENNDWTTVNDEINTAEENFVSVVNNLDFSQDKQYCVNRAYVCLMELKNSLKSKDKDIFYINYRNFMESVNCL